MRTIAALRVCVCVGATPLPFGKRKLFFRSNVSVRRTCTCLSHVKSKQKNEWILEITQQANDANSSLGLSRRMQARVRPCECVFREFITHRSVPHIWIAGNCVCRYMLAGACVPTLAECASVVNVIRNAIDFFKHFHLQRSSLIQWISFDRFVSFGKNQKAILNRRIFIHKNHDDDLQ